MDKLSFWFQPQLLQGLQPLAYQEIARFNRKVCRTGLSRNSIIPPEGGTTNDMQFPVTRRVGFFVFKINTDYVQELSRDAGADREPGYAARLHN